ALGLQDQSLTPRDGPPDVEVSAVTPGTGVGGMNEEPVDAAPDGLERTSSRATRTSNRPTDRARTRIIRREPGQPTPLDGPGFRIAHGALWAFIARHLEPSRQPLPKRRRGRQGSPRPVARRERRSARGQRRSPDESTPQLRWLSRGGRRAARHGDDATPPRRCLLRT